MDTLYRRLFWPQVHIHTEEKTVWTYIYSSLFNLVFYWNEIDTDALLYLQEINGENTVDLAKVIVVITIDRVNWHRMQLTAWRLP